MAGPWRARGAGPGSSSRSSSKGGSWICACMRTVRIGAMLAQCRHGCSVHQLCVRASAWACFCSRTWGSAMARAHACVHAYALPCRRGRWSTSSLRWQQHHRHARTVPAWLGRSGGSRCRTDATACHSRGQQRQAEVPACARGCALPACRCTPATIVPPLIHSTHARMPSTGAAGTG